MFNCIRIATELAMKMRISVGTNLLVWIFVCSLGARDPMPDPMLDPMVDFAESNTGLNTLSPACLSNRQIAPPMADSLSAPVWVDIVQASAPVWVDIIQVSDPAWVDIVQASDPAWVNTVAVVKPLSDSLSAPDSALHVAMPLLGYRGDMKVLMVTNNDEQSDPYQQSDPYRSYQLIKKLANSGELSLFSSLYFPFRPQQMLLLKQYLKKPDTLHLNCLKLAWEGLFPADMVSALLQQQITRPGIWDDKQFVCLPDFVEYKGKLEPVSAVVLNGFFPKEGEIPNSIRAQVESIRALVSLALLDQSNAFIPYENRLEIHPSFGTYESLNTFLDSYDSLRVVYDHWVDPGQLSDLKAFAGYLIQSRLNDNNLISVFEKRVEIAHQIAMAKGKTILLIPGFEQCIARAKFNKNVSPSMLDEIIMAGVSCDSIARCFTLFGTEELPPYIVVKSQNLNAQKTWGDSGSSVNNGQDGHNSQESQNPIAQKTWSDSGSSVNNGHDNKDRQDRQDSQNSPNSQDSLFSLYTCLDSMPIKTSVLHTEMQESSPMDAATALDEAIQPTRNLFGLFAPTRLESGKSRVEISYLHLLGLYKSNAVNTLLQANGLAEIPQFSGRGIFQSQGISMAIQRRNASFLYTNRITLSQSNTIENANLSGFYALYYKTLGIELGKFVQIEFGSLLGYVQHKVKRFSGFNGGFINQDQPSIVVTNPACISGISVSPSVHFDLFKINPLIPTPQHAPQTRHLFLRMTVGYARDLGSGSWVFKGNKMYSPGDFKSTGWYNSAEFGFAAILNSKKKSADEVDVVSRAQKNR